MGTRSERHAITMNDSLNIVDHRSVGDYDIYFEAKYSVFVINRKTRSATTFHMWDADNHDFDRFVRLDLFKTKLRHSTALTYSELFKLARVCNMSSISRMTTKEEFEDDLAHHYVSIREIK